MPYASNADLPAPVRARYSERCQTVFRRVFNETQADGRSESSSFAIAHSAAHNCMESRMDHEMMHSALKYLTGPITKADSGSLDAVITSLRTDRDGEVVVPTGITNRDDWLANPLIFWAHEWAFDPGAEPIGKGTRLDVFPDRIESSAEWAPTPKAQNVRALVRGGFVRKTSIGFDPGEVRAIDGVPHHIAWALREWSIVPMPANTDATITGVKSALSWLAEQWQEATDDGATVTVGADRLQTLVTAAVRDALTLASDGPSAVTLTDGRRVIATLRRRRRAVIRAVWSASYINALPDSAFACIDGAGRHYPHHNAQGALDPPHLRAALSRIGDPSNVQCGKEHLRRHARAEGIGE